MAKPVSSTVIQFSYQVRKFRLSNIKKIKKSLLTLFETESQSLRFLSVVFCSDEYLIEMNTRFLSHDYYTDILTFDLSDSPRQIIGEIYISIDRVRENAKHFKIKFPQELQRVIFHGALHLCGFNDHTPKEKTQMLKLEETYLQLFNENVPRET